LFQNLLFATTSTFIVSPTTIIVYHKLLKNVGETVNMDILGADVTIKHIFLNKCPRKIVIISSVFSDS
jgi:hypothetical protein